MLQTESDLLEEVAMLLKLGLPASGHFDEDGDQSDLEI